MKQDKIYYRIQYKSIEFDGIEKDYIENEMLGQIRIGNNRIEQNTKRYQKTKKIRSYAKICDFRKSYTFQFPTRYFHLVLPLLVSKFLKISNFLAQLECESSWANNCQLLCVVNKFRLVASRRLSAVPFAT